MKSFVGLVMCAALVCGAHARPNTDELEKALDELKLYLESKLEEKSNSVKELHERQFDPFDFNGPELPEDFTLELTEQDLQDLDEEDVSDDELRQEEEELELLRQEVEEISDLDERPSGATRRQLQEYTGAQTIEKRFLGSVIVWTLTLVSSGYTLYNAVTKGCGIYPSICTDKDAIARLTGEIDTLKEEYDDKYIEGLHEYLNLQQIMDNNWYITYYTDEALQTFESINNITRRTQLYLAAHLPTLTKIYNSGNMTSEEYLEAVIGTLAVTLEDVEKMLGDAQTAGYKAVALNLGAQLLVTYFFDTYNQVKKANPRVKQNRLDKIADLDINEADRNALGNPKHPAHRSTMRRIGAKLKGGMLSFGSYIKRRFVLVGKTLYSMARRPFAYFSLKVQQAGGLRQFFKPKRIFNSFKAKAIGKTKAVMTKIKTSWRTLKTGGLRQFSKPGFKISWSNTLSTAISAALAGIQIAMDTKQWAQVRDDMRGQRINYENYKKELVKQRQSLTDDMTKQELEFEKAFDTFTNLTGNFKEIIATATEHSEVSDATNIGFHYNMDNPVFEDGYLDVINKGNVEIKQNNVLKLIKEDMNEDFFSAKEILEGRSKFYEICLENYNETNDVAETFDKVQSAMEHSGSLEKAQYSRSLTKKDVVCFYALVLSDLTQYDFYYLEPMRPMCEITDQEWRTLQQQATINRYKSLVEDVVVSSLNEGIDNVNDITRNVVWSFNHGHDQDKMDFAATIQNKDILCVIAGIKPDEYFDFYALALYRNNDCSAITEEQARQSEEDANRIRAKIESVKTYSDLCANPQFPNCMCFGIIAQALQATDPSVNESTVKQLLHTLNPESSQWCASAMYSASCNPMCVPY